MLLASMSSKFRFPNYHFETTLVTQGSSVSDMEEPTMELQGRFSC